MKNYKVPFGRKIISFLIALSFILSFNIVLADSCDELRPVLDKYYEAGQAENIEVYMEVMDQEYLRENLLDNYEDYVKSAWEAYDTKSYELSSYNCKIEDKNALMYFNMKSTLESDGKEVELQKNYVASLHNVDGWKIKYVMDEEVFSQLQSSLHTQLFLDATKDVTDKDLNIIDDLIAYDKVVQEIESGDYQDDVLEGVAPRPVIKDEKSDTNVSYYILFIAFVAVVFVVIKKKKSRD